CVYSFRLTATPQLYSLSLHDALPIYEIARREVVIDQDDLVEPRALDLGADLRLRLGNGVVHVRRARVFLMRRSRHNTAFGPSGKPRAACRHRARRTAPRLTNIRDRKSTRLNSSHT